MDQEKKILAVTALGKYGFELVRATVSNEVEIQVYIPRSKLAKLLKSQGILEENAELPLQSIFTEADFPALCDPNYPTINGFENIIWKTATGARLALFTDPELFKHAQVILVGQNMTGVEETEERPEYAKAGEVTLLRHQAEFFPPDVPVISITKSISSICERPTEIMAKLFPNPTAVIAGPSLDQTLAESIYLKRIRQRLNLAGDEATRSRLRQFFDSSKLQFTETDDKKATEILAAIKNPLSFMLGILNGYAADTNTFLTAEAITLVMPLIHIEIKKILKQLGVNEELFEKSPAGLPDLALTIQHGRNGKCGRKVGELFASWKKNGYPETQEDRVLAIQQEVLNFGGTVEGYKSLQAICTYFANREIANHEMFLLHATKKVILDGRQFNFVLKAVERLISFEESE